MPLQTRRPAARARPFPPRRDYASPSIHDLLDARDAYHVQLPSLSNVVATAVGRYLIHERDWLASHRGEHDAFIPSRSLDGMAQSGEFEP